MNIHRVTATTTLVLSLPLFLSIAPASLADNYGSRHHGKHHKDDNPYALTFLYGEADQVNRARDADTLSATEVSKGIRLSGEINRALSLELGYSDFGAAATSYIDGFGDTITDTLDTSAAQLGIAARIPFGRVVSLTGRFGIASWQLDYSNTDSAFPGDVYRDSDEGVDPYVGVGLAFEFEDSLTIGVEYTGLEFDAALGAVKTRHTVDNVSLSLGLRF